jgi:surfactin synthase thioesterase subunit
LSFFEGDHFFVRTHARELCTQLADHLLTNQPRAFAAATSGAER